MADVKITPPPLTKDGGVVICLEGGGTDWLSLNHRRAHCFANVSFGCKASTLILPRGLTNVFYKGDFT